MSEDSLMLAISQTTNAVTFSQTHDVDEDFRAHSRATMSTLRPLQAEQRSRIAQAYSARPPSPTFLATQLLAAYRGEAASVQLAKESDDPTNCPTAITVMSNAQCRTFKKEMKQRIHEWEGAVREATGQEEVQADQKAPLRSIYELYKASKNKVVSSDGPHRQSEHISPRNAEQSQPASASVRVSTTGDEAAGARPGSAGSAAAAAPASTVNAASSSNTRLSISSNALRTSTASEAAVRPSQPLTGTVDRADIVGSKIPRVTIGTAPVETMSLADIQTEKRKLKQVLHRFETDFASLYGEPPSRRDRRTFSGEYHRYGVLKTELAKRESTGGDKA